MFLTFLWVWAPCSGAWQLRRQEEVAAGMRRGCRLLSLQPEIGRAVAASLPPCLWLVDFLAGQTPNSSAAEIRESENGLSRDRES